MINFQNFWIDLKVYFLKLIIKKNNFESKKNLKLFYK